MKRETPTVSIVPATRLDRRVAAAQATLDKFRGRPFKLGTNDCARLVAYHCRKLGRPIKVARAGSYKTPASARLALKRLGFDTLAAAADAFFPRIPPAAAIVGDLLELPSEGSTIGALGVSLGNGRVICFHQDADGAIVGEAVEIVGAWRTL